MGSKPSSGDDEAGWSGGSRVADVDEVHGRKGHPLPTDEKGQSPRAPPQTHGAFFNVETERGETFVCVSSLTWGAWDPDPFPVGCGSLNAEVEWALPDREERSLERTTRAFGRIVRIGRSRLPVFDRSSALHMEGLLEPVRSPPVGVFRAVPIDDDAGATRKHGPVPMRYWRARLLMDRDLLYRVYLRLEERHRELRYAVPWNHAQDTVDKLLQWALSIDANRFEFIAVCTELDELEDPQDELGEDSATSENHRVLDMVNLETLVRATLRITEFQESPRTRLSVISPGRPARRAWVSGHASVSDSRITCRFEPRGDSDAGQLVYALSYVSRDTDELVWCPVAYAASGTDDGCVSCVLLSSLFHPPGIQPVRIRGSVAQCIPSVCLMPSTGNDEERVRNVVSTLRGYASFVCMHRDDLPPKQGPKQQPRSAVWS